VEQEIHLQQVLLKVGLVEIQQVVVLVVEVEVVQWLLDQTHQGQEQEELVE
jgi:hypothetical protein